METVLVEVHATDGNPKKFAGTWAAKEYGGKVVEVVSAHQRCAHGYLVWEVTLDGINS